MKQKHANRVLTALEHFRNLPDEMVDLSTWSSYDAPENTSFEEDDQALRRNLKNRVPDCGTTACFAGWLPFIFPRHWEHRFDDAPKLRTGASYCVEQDVARFLGTDPLITVRVVSDNVEGGKIAVTCSAKAPWLPDCEGEELPEPSDREKIIEWLEAELDRNGYEIT